MPHAEKLELKARILLCEFLYAFRTIQKSIESSRRAIHRLSLSEIPTEKKDPEDLAAADEIEAPFNDALESLHPVDATLKNIGKQAINVSDVIVTIKTIFTSDM
jgi:hypothetical protein